MVRAKSMTTCTAGLDIYHLSMFTVLLLSQTQHYVPSGICAKLRTVAASNNRVHMP